MVGVTLADTLDAPEVAARALDAGLVLNVPGPRMLRFLPPLVINEAEVDEALAVLRRVLG
jgi:acetylornithine/N-succinyldiaminopimelate aminotransferase